MSQLIIIFYSLYYSWTIQLIAVKNNDFEILNIIIIFFLDVSYVIYIVIVH